MKKLSRKEFIKNSSLTASALLLKPDLLIAQKHTIKAIAFDGLVVFDPRPVFKKINELFPEKGKELVDVFQSKQFSYQWLRSCGHQYKDFWEITKGALDFAFEKFNLKNSANEKKIILQQFETITVWPDVVSNLQKLKEQNLKLCLLSNMTEKMLLQFINNSNTKTFFDHVISTDIIHDYKPSPSAYQLGIHQLRLKKEEILFVPFAGWDLAGAKWFGYPAFWVNRLNAPMEKLDASFDGSGADFFALTEFVKKYNNQNM